MIRVPCILCRGTEHEVECLEGNCRAQQLDLTDHPVDVLKDLAARAGFEMSPEAEADMRRVCDEMVPVEHQPAMAMIVRRATEDWSHG